MQCREKLLRREEMLDDVIEDEDRVRRQDVRQLFDSCSEHVDPDVALLQDRPVLTPPAWIAAGKSQRPKPGGIRKSTEKASAAAPDVEHTGVLGEVERPLQVLRNGDTAVRADLVLSSRAIELGV